MRNIFKKLWAISFLAVLCACTNTEQFRVNGKLEGNPTLNLRVGYYSDGVYNTLITAARDGEFEFYGSSRQPALVEIFDYDYRLLARLFAANGETMTVDLSGKYPYGVKMEGNAVTEEWSKFLNDNADSLKAGSKAANAVIARYIGSNPGKVLSSLLLVKHYDASADIAGADSLLTLIEPKARPTDITAGFEYALQRMMAAGCWEPVEMINFLDRRDSLRIFNPSAYSASLIAFTEASQRTPSQELAAFRRMKKNAKKRFEILDMALDPDTVQWKRGTRNDTATWVQGWAAASLAGRGVDKLAIPSIPFYIVCDSAGRQIYRGTSIAEAEKNVNNLVSPR